MRLLIVFLATATASLALLTATNWWVDPFGQFWKPAAVRAAETPPRCLISRALFRGDQLPFKLGLFHSRPTRTIVLGGSRVTTIAARRGETSFTNLGMLDAHLSDALWLARRIPPTPRQTVYLGVEVFWFNPNSGRHDFAPGLVADARYLVSLTTLSASLRALRAAPDALYRRWKRASVDGRCIVGHGLANDDAWRPDGTFVWRTQLTRPPTELDPVTAQVLEDGFFGGFTSFAPGPLHDLSELLALAHERHWTVVGFATPYPASYVTAFEHDPRLRSMWRAFGRIVPPQFRRYGYPWLDLRNARSIPCSDREFVDGGFHTDLACSARMRAKLDAAGARYRLDR